MHVLVRHILQILDFFSTEKHKTASFQITKSKKIEGERFDVTGNLTIKGITNEVKAKLRAEIFSILEDNSYEKPKLSQENLLINDLIREYMDFNHYNYSKSVFLKGNYKEKNSK